MSMRWFTRGTASGQVIGLSGWSQLLAHMPITDIKSRWLAGCFAGTILGMAGIDQSNGG
jgi:hypothetical protein